MEIEGGEQKLMVCVRYRKLMTSNMVSCKKLMVSQNYLYPRFIIYSSKMMQIMEVRMQTRSIKVWMTMNDYFA